MTREATTVGFTGSEEGMTAAQSEGVAEEILRLRLRGLEEAHHGVCIGSDQEFHELVRSIAPQTKIVGWPGVNRHGASPKRATIDDLDEEMPEKFYLERNWDVAGRDVLIAAPEGSEVARGSGTWATIRRARKLGTPRVIFYPDGSREEER